MGVTETELGKVVAATLLPDRDDKGQPIRWGSPEQVGRQDLARGQTV